MRFEFGVKYVPKRQTLVVIVKRKNRWRVLELNHHGISSNTYKEKEGRVTSGN